MSENQKQKLGSSPRVRGADDDVTITESTIGIIPARAGSSDMQKSLGIGNEGSSPRVRGAVSVYSVNHYWLGIIPARAGSRLKNPS